jgi:transcriptional regulator with XRE-family HTH domain
MSTMDVGAQLREIRISRRLSQRELAKRAGVTNGMISLIEQNRVSPSISSLGKVLAGIPMSLSEFFAREGRSEPSVFYLEGPLREAARGRIETRAVAGERAAPTVTLCYQQFAPEADTGPEPVVSVTERIGVIARGEVEISAAGETRTLRVGDAFCFPAGLAYRIRNRGAEHCEIISGAGVQPAARCP